MKQKRITALIMVLLWCVSFFMPSSAVFAETLVDDASVQTATLTINYCLDDETGNMIHEPYVAEQVVGSAYTVASPEIDGFRLKDEQQKTLTGTLQQDTTITVNYIYAEQTFPYTIVYEGYDPSTNTTVTLDTVTGYAPADTKVAVEYREFWGYDKDNVDDMSLVVTADGQASKTLTYTLKDDPYIIFRTQGSYVQPITAEVGKNIASQIQDIQPPTRAGYTFAGWEYEGKTYSNASELAEALSEMPTVLTYVNAVWKPGEANYTVLAWFENADDDGYTLYSNIEERSGMVGAKVTASAEDIANGENNEDAASNPYFGFDYARCEDTTILPDGTAVLNLYYDREIWKINYMERDNETVWKTIEGKYMSLIGDKLLSTEVLKEHYGQGFAYMAKTKNGNDSAMLERFENSQPKTAGYGEQNIYPYFDNNLYQYQIRHFSYDPNADDQTEQILIRTSYIYYYKSFAPGIILYPPEGFTWKGGWWKTATTEAGLENAYEKKNPQGTGQDEKATFYSVYPYMDIYMERDKSTLTYISNDETIQQIENVPYEKNLDLSLVPTNGEEHMQFEGWYTDPNLMNYMEPLSEYQMPASDLNLYAKWGPVDYTVTFDTQGGSEVSQQTVKYNTSAKEPETPTRPGYTFTGWYTEPEGGSIWAFEQTISGDTTLYAHWRESVTASYTINHVINGESEPFYQETGISTVGDTIYATALSPQDEHYPSNVYLEPQAASQSITLNEDGSKNTVTFTYNKIGEKEYTVLYKEKDSGKILEAPKHVTGTLCSVVTELPKKIDGYSCTDEDGYETVTLSETEENQIVFYYQQDGETVPNQWMIYPEDQTIYTGGEDGDVNNLEFPRAIYLVEDEDGTVSEVGDMKFILNRDSSQSYAAEDLFEVKYYSKDGSEIESDQTYGDFSARITPKDEYKDDLITTQDGKTIRFEEGTLRIRYVSSFTEASQNALTVHAVEYGAEYSEEQARTQVEQSQKAGVILDASSKIYLNGKEQYEYPSDAPYQIALLFDELLPTTPNGSSDDYKQDLIEHAEDQGFSISKKQSMFRYLDLVDTNDSDAWVSSSEGCDVFWPYPSGTNKETDFELLHFEGLHREYRMEGEDGLQEQIDKSQVEEVTVEKTDAGIWFHVGESGFSPFALVWEDTTSPVNPDDGDDDTPSTPVTPPDGDDTPNLNTTDHFSYIVGYPEDYRTGEPTDDESLWPVKPQGNITRAEVATIFYRLLTDEARTENWTQDNSFTDVDKDDWFNTPVSTLSAMGIISGYEDGSFQPNAPITRAEFAAIAVRFFEEDSAIYEEGTFNDIVGGEWFADAVQAAKDHGIIGGYPDGSFQPNKNISRAEACSIINRTLDRIPDEDHLLPVNDMRNWPDNLAGAWYYADMQEATNGHEYEWITDNGKTVENWTGELPEIDWDEVERELCEAHGVPYEG